MLGRGLTIGPLTRTNVSPAARYDLHAGNYSESQRRTCSDNHSQGPYPYPSLNLGARRSAVSEGCLDAFARLQTSQSGL